jgi:hypothetical protein
MDAVQGFFCRSQVGQAQLSLDHFNVGNRVDLAGDVNHVVVFKAAHHIDGGVGLANVGQKLVTQAFAGAGTGHQTCNVHKFHHGRNHPLGFNNGGELRHARIGHFHNTHIGLDGAKGVIFRGNPSLGQGVEQRGFTDVRQAYNATLQTHKYL